MDLTQRRRQPELMDQPGLDAERHRQALAGLQRINRASGSGRHVWQALRRLAAARRLSGLQLLDIASGGGDVAIWLARQGLAAGLDLRVEGCDISGTAVAHAQQAAQRAGVPHVHFFQHDALQQPFQQTYDVVICSLFLHHLDTPQAIDLLRTMAAAARYAVFVDDLRRTRLGYALAWLGCRLLSRSAIVHEDGPLSVQGAFTVREVLELADQAGLNGATVLQHWPQRFLLCWSRG